MEAAANHTLPKLVEVGDIQGVFHNHTVYSDGGNTVEEMARAAKALGFEYFGLGDHSQSLTVANGLTPDRVRAQQKEVDAVRKKMKGFHIFKGTECDILEDGSLDYDDDLLATFDYVVASVHSFFNQTREVMTARIVRAVRHPRVTMLGHATGRLLLQARQLPRRPRRRAPGGRRERHDDRDQRRPAPAGPRLGPLQAGQGAGRAARHQPRRPQHGGPGELPLRRRRGAARLAGEEERVQHAERRRGGEGVARGRKGG